MDVVYANRSSMDVMFAEELGDLKDKYPARLAVHHVPLPRAADLPADVRAGSTTTSSRSCWTA